MEKLAGFQKKYLRGQAHGLNPVVFIGQKGFTQTVIKATDNALTAHELIKIKFIDFKDKADKAQIISEVEEKTGCEMIGVIGHTAIFYRQHPDPEKQRIVLPVRKA